MNPWVCCPSFGPKRRPLTSDQKWEATETGSGGFCQVLKDLECLDDEGLISLKGPVLDDKQVASGQVVRSRFLEPFQVNKFPGQAATEVLSGDEVTIIEAEIYVCSVGVGAEIL